jgi:hypothetical protein
MGGLPVPLALNAPVKPAPVQSGPAELGCMPTKLGTVQVTTCVAVAVSVGAAVGVRVGVADAGADVAVAPAVGVLVAGAVVLVALAVGVAVLGTGVAVGGSAEPSDTLVSGAAAAAETEMGPAKGIGTTGRKLYVSWTRAISTASPGTTDGPDSVVLPVDVAAGVRRTARKPLDSPAMTVASVCAAGASW